MIRNCPICNNKDKKKIYTKDFHTKDTIVDKYDVVVCKRCGMTYADNIPTQAEYDNYYANMSKYEFKLDNGEPSKGFKDHAKNVFDFIEPYLTDKNASILDIGCSTGALLMEFKANGYDSVAGVDPSETCIEYTRNKGLHLTYKATISDIKGNGEYGTYDLIVLSAVLEHVVDIQEALTIVTNMLSTGGLLFLNVPDLDRFEQYIDVPYSQFNSEHVNYFTEETLERLLKQFNYDYIDSEDRIVVRTPKAQEPDIFLLVQKQEIIIDQLTDYLAACKKKEEKIIDKVKKIKGPIVVWGVGEHTRWIYPHLNVAYFIDSDMNYIGKSLNGKLIASPKALFLENMPILVSSYVHQEEIVAQIKEMGLTNEVITLW